MAGSTISRLKRRVAEPRAFRHLIRGLENFLELAPKSPAAFACQLVCLGSYLSEYVASHDDHSVTNELAVRSALLLPTLDVFRSHQDERIGTLSILSAKARDANPEDLDEISAQAKDVIHDVFRLQQKKSDCVHGATNAGDVDGRGEL